MQKMVEVQALKHWSILLTLQEPSTKITFSSPHGEVPPASEITGGDGTYGHPELAEYIFSEALSKSNEKEGIRKFFVN